MTRAQIIQIFRSSRSCHPRASLLKGAEVLGNDHDTRSDHSMIPTSRLRTIFSYNFLTRWKLQKRLETSILLGLDKAQNEPSKVCYTGLTPYNWTSWIHFSQPRSPLQGARELRKDSWAPDGGRRGCAESNFREPVSQLNSVPVVHLLLGICSRSYAREILLKDTTHL